MKKLIILFILLVLCGNAEAYITKDNYVFGTMGSDPLLSADAEDATFTVVMSSAYSGDFPACSNTNPCRLTVFSAACAQPSSCAAREIIDVKSVSASCNAGDTCTLTLKSHNSETTSYASNWAEGDKVQMQATAGYFTDSGYGYLTLSHPHVRGAEVTTNTTDSDEMYGQMTFKHNIEQDNYVEYRLEVPRDIDTSVDLVAWFKFVLGGADTGDHDYILDMTTVADSGDYTGTMGTYPIHLSYTPDASGASGDVETAGGDTLTGWKAALTAGHLWILRITRNGDDDSSTTVSTTSVLTIRYRRSL